MYIFFLCFLFRPGSGGDFKCVDGSAKIPWDQVKKRHRIFFSKNKYM